MQDEGVIEARPDPVKLKSRCQDSGALRHDGKFDLQAVSSALNSHLVQDIMSGSPRKKGKVDYFRGAPQVPLDVAAKAPINPAGSKPVSDQKTRDLVGQNHLVPAPNTELRERERRHGSPDKHNRVDGYMGSRGMKDALSYMGNDPTSGLIDTKSTNRAIFSTKDANKDTWKPRNKAQWTEPARQALTLQ